MRAITKYNKNGYWWLLSLAGRSEIIGLDISNDGSQLCEAITYFFPSATEEEIKGNEGERGREKLWLLLHDVSEYVSRNGMDSIQLYSVCFALTYMLWFLFCPEFKLPIDIFSAPSRRAHIKRIRFYFLFRAQVRARQSVRLDRKLRAQIEDVQENENGVWPIRCKSSQNSWCFFHRAAARLGCECMAVNGASVCKVY